MNDNKLIFDTTFTEFLLYKTSDGDVKIEVFLKNESLWITQGRMAELFDTTKQNISLHLKNIFNVKELEENSVVKDFLTTANDGKQYKTKFYNLDVIIAVGYRVNSARATLFRIWATKILNEYIRKGFVMDDERLKNPNNIFGKDYFDEQLARIKDIRSSERRFYQKITDIYSQCSDDYDLNKETTKKFFATVQNKLHYAITGQTAAEIVHSRVDGEKENMGLTSWKNAPDGKIRKTDIEVAKNYLTESELNKLNRIVSMYLDYAEDQAEQGIVMYMEDWVGRLDEFLKFNRRDILKNFGKVTQEMAKALAEKEYEKYTRRMDALYESDFDKIVAEVAKKGK